MNRAPVHRYLAGAAALAAAGLAAAACGSSAPATSAGSATPAASATSGASGAAPRTGTQTLSGSLAGQAALANSPAIPIRLTGLVNSSATLHLNNSRQNPVTFRTPQGNLTVTHTQGTSSQRLLSTQTCRFAFGQHSRYTVVGGKSTGTFRGATGSGTAVITFTGNLPKKNGRCDTSSSAEPMAAGLRVSFVAHGPLTVR